MLRIFLASTLLLGTANPDTPDRCLRLKPNTAIGLAGELTTRVFPGPPNYENVAKGDAAERVFILKLPSPICIDGDEFIDSATTFDEVQISSSDPKVIAALKSAAGRKITVHGDAFGAHTGHHHAPMVLLADRVRAP